MQSTSSASTYNIQGGNLSAFVPTQLYSTANDDTRNANMPMTSGVLPLTLRAGNPLTTYRLNKIETPAPGVDYIYFHLEKYSPLDALWYPQWIRLSLYCEMTRQILMAVIQASIEKPERSNFMTTLVRILALPDEGPRAEGNPLSTRFHWRAPMHQYMWSWVQHGESPWDRSFQVHPQPPHRPRVDINSFQRAMFRHLTLDNETSTTTTAVSTPTTVSSTTSASRAGAAVFDADSSDTESVNTTAAVIFPTPSKRKVLQKRNSRTREESTSMPSTSEN